MFFLKKIFVGWRCRLRQPFLCIARRRCRLRQPFLCIPGWHAAGRRYSGAPAGVEAAAAGSTLR